MRKPLWNDLEEAREQILWGLKQADVVKLSDEEAFFLWNTQDPKEAAKIIFDGYDVKLVFITLGAKGCYYANKKASGKVIAPAVKCIDTTGAGDIFGGSALNKILKLGKSVEDLNEEELEEICTFAVTAASLSTEKIGGMSSVPEEKEVLAYLR